MNTNSSGTSSVLLRMKQKLLETRLKQYDAVVDNLITVQSGANKVALEEQLEQLEAEILKLEQEVQVIRQTSAIQSGSDTSQVRAVRREYDDVWKGKIHRIDFSQSRKIFKPVLNQFEDTGGAVLFFLQKSALLGGEWCAQAIRDHLDTLELNLTAPREFAFEADKQFAEPEPFLNYLASKYDVPPKEESEDLKAYIHRINQAIWMSLYAGHVFWLKVEVKCLVNDDDKFIKWFVNEFWQNLCQPLNPSERIRLVGILSVDVEVPNCVVKELRCTKSKFDARKLLPLPLYKWKKEEILGWLIDHSDLSKPPISLRQEQLETIASSIYAKSNSGQPNTVYNQLMSDMSQRVG